MPGRKSFIHKKLNEGWGEWVSKPLLEKEYSLYHLSPGTEKYFQNSDLMAKKDKKWDFFQQ